MNALFATLCTAVALTLATHAGPAPGQPAPDFSARDINGRTHRLSDFQGKLVVIESINLDCPFSANHYRTGAMQALQGAVTSKGGVWLLVGSSGPGQPGHRAPDAARRDFAAQGMKATAWLDDSSGTIGRLYGLQTTPQVVVINSQGKVAYCGAVDDRPVSSGDPRTASSHVKQAVEALLAGKPVALAESKPYGTPIPYAR